jgi:hypothetical protein
LLSPSPGPAPLTCPPERIAAFDNDGTLWCEKPLYVQADFVFRRWKQMIQADPAKMKEQPYEALAENDQAWLAGLLGHVPELVKGLGEAYEGITVGAFEQAVDDTLARWVSRLRRNRTGSAGPPGPLSAPEGP